MKITYDYLPIRNGEDGCRSGIKLDKHVFDVDHDTGDPHATARNVVDYYKTIANKVNASFHWIADDKGVIITIPCFIDEGAEKAWHVNYSATLDNELFGCNANDCAIGGELCYFPNDLERSKKAYDRYVEMSAHICLRNGKNPAHREAHGRLQPWNRTDPNNALGYLGLTYDDMKADIVKEYNRMSFEQYFLMNADEITKQSFSAPDAWVSARDFAKVYGKIENVGDGKTLQYIDESFEKIWQTALQIGYDLGKKSNQ